MGKIKKILENELIGGTQSTDVYPVTSTKAVYDENNERLDNILKGVDTKFTELGNIQYDSSFLQKGYYNNTNKEIGDIMVDTVTSSETTYSLLVPVYKGEKITISTTVLKPSIGGYIYTDNKKIIKEISNEFNVSNKTIDIIEDGYLVTQCHTNYFSIFKIIRTGGWKATEQLISEFKLDMVPSSKGIVISYKDKIVGEINNANSENNGLLSTDFYKDLKVYSDFKYQSTNLGTGIYNDYDKNIGDTLTEVITSSKASKSIKIRVFEGETIKLKTGVTDLIPLYILTNNNLIITDINKDIGDIRDFSIQITENGFLFVNCQNVYYTSFLIQRIAGWKPSVYALERIEKLKIATYSVDSDYYESGYYTFTSSEVGSYSVATKHNSTATSCIKIPVVKGEKVIISTQIQASIPTVVLINDLGIIEEYISDRIVSNRILNIESNGTLYINNYNDYKNFNVERLVDTLDIIAALYKNEIQKSTIISSIYKKSFQQYGVCWHLTREEQEGQYREKGGEICREATSFVRSGLYLASYVMSEDDLSLKSEEELNSLFANDFANYDACIDVLERNNNKWLPTVAAFEGIKGSDLTDLMFTNYGIALKYFVKRYKDKVSYWEISNELDLYQMENRNNYTYEQCLRIYKTAYEAIKSVDQNINVLIGGLTSSNTYIDEMTKLGFYNYFDIMNIHIYPTVSNVESKITSSLKYIREVMSNWGKEMPIWVTEYGFSTFEATEENQSSVIGRGTILLAALGVENMFIYCLRDIETATPGKEQHFGLFDYTLETPKKAYGVYKFISHILKGQNSICVNKYTDYCIAKWTSDGIPYSAIWATDKSLVVDIKVANDYYEVLSEDGTKIELPKELGTSIIILKYATDVELRV